MTDAALQPRNHKSLFGRLWCRNFLQRLLFRQALDLSNILQTMPGPSIGRAIF